MTGLEAAFAALILAAFGRWLARVIKRVMFPWEKWGQAPDPAGVRSEDGFWRDEVDGLVAWLHERAVPQEFSASGEVRRHLDAVRNFLVRMPDEVFEQIRRELIQGHNEGDSTKAIADKIQRILDITGSEDWRNRAQTVAVTEVNGALNSGWFAGAVAQQAQLGEPLSKQWIATHDTHTRPDHRVADGQTVPLLSPFVVGTSLLMYPGDKAGPPSEIVNCRCAAAIVAP